MQGKPRKEKNKQKEMQNRDPKERRERYRRVFLVSIFSPFTLIETRILFSLFFF